MFDHPPPANRFGKTTYDVLYVAVAALGSSQAFQFALQQYVTTELWRMCIANDPLTGMLVSFSSIAVISGLIFGLIVGAATGARALRLAGWAALVVCILHFAAAIAAGGAGWALNNPVLVAPFFIGLGLILGALLGRRVWSANP
jgi:hypothetical protein